MGLLDIICDTVSSVVTTVKEAVAPKSTQKVSLKENIPIVSNDALEEGNTDRVEIKNNKSRDNAYKLIEELCVKYNIDISEAKEANFLEEITGYSSEELAAVSKEDLKPYIDALDTTLSRRRWTFWKSNSGVDNLKEIAKDANNKYIDNTTGRSWWNNFCDWIAGNNGDLAERMKKAGFTAIDEKSVIEFFHKQIQEAIDSGDKGKIKDALDEALQVFGSILKNTEDPEQKALLTAAVQELEANKRLQAMEMTLRSCGNNLGAKQVVAKGISDNYIAATSNADALKQCTSEDDNTAISVISYQYMTEEDAISALNNTKAYIQSLEAKIRREEALTESEQRYYDSVRYSHYAGAMIGASCSESYSNPANVLGIIDTDTAELGIQERVYQTAASYIESKGDSLTITEEQFAQKVNNATNGNYTKTLNNSTSNGDKSRNTTTDKKPSNEVTAEQTPSNRRTQGMTTGEEVVHTRSSSGNNQIDFTPAESSQTTRNTIHDTKQNTPIKTTFRAESEEVCVKPEVVTRYQAIQNGIKAVKEYAKNNNVNTLDLAIDSLNSNNASSATRKWALSQFKAASDSTQLLNFNKITHGASAIAAAATMEDRTRNQIREFRSYYIKESVEKIKEDAMT